MDQAEKKSFHPGQHLKCVFYCSAFHIGEPGSGPDDPHKEFQVTAARRKMSRTVNLALSRGQEQGHPTIVNVEEWRSTQWQAPGTEYIYVARKWLPQGGWQPPRISIKIDGGGHMVDIYVPRQRRRCRPVATERIEDRDGYVRKDGILTGPELSLYTEVIGLPFFQREPELTEQLGREVPLQLRDKDLATWLELQEI